MRFAMYSDQISIITSIFQIDLKLLIRKWKKKTIIITIDVDDSFTLLCIRVPNATNFKSIGSRITSRAKRIVMRGLNTTVVL